MPQRSYLEGHGDLVTGLVMGIIGIILWLTGAKNILTNSPDTQGGNDYNDCPLTQTRDESAECCLQQHKKNLIPTSIIQTMPIVTAPVRGFMIAGQRLKGLSSVDLSLGC